MTTNEMRADVKKLLKRVDEDAKGTRCLTMAEVTLCLDELRRLATPSVASPRAAWKDDALQSRINEAVDEANGVAAAPVGKPGRTPQAMSAIDCESVAGKTTLAVTQGCRAPDLPQQPCYTCEGEKGLPATRAVYICADCAGDDEPTAPPAQGAPGTREHEIQRFACKNCGLVASLCKYHTRCLAALDQPGAPTKEGTCKEKLFS
jgi:hypothetical protein